jgi:transposase
MLKHRIHAQLMQFGHACPVSDLFGRSGRELLERLDLPDPWRSDVLAAIDDLDREIGAIGRELRRLGADHPYVALLQTVPGIAWVLGYTIAAEIGDINRFASPRRSGTCSPATNPSLRQAPRSLWPHTDGPHRVAPPDRDSHLTKSSRRGRDTEMSPARTPPHARDP